MPSTKDFEKKEKKNSGNGEMAEETSQSTHTAHHEKRAKRRPGRDHESHEEHDISAAHHSEDVKVVDVDTAPSHDSHTSHNEDMAADSHGHAHDGPKVEIKFAGSEILRAKFPKPFEVAETIATDWVQDGKFDDLDLGHPLAQYFAAKGLKKAKEMEKKVLESPVTEKVAMQALQAGMKAQEIINQVRAKIKR